MDVLTHKAFLVSFGFGMIFVVGFIVVMANTKPENFIEKHGQNQIDENGVENHWFYVRRGELKYSKKMTFF